MERSVAADKLFFLAQHHPLSQLDHLDKKWAGKSGFGLFAGRAMELAGPSVRSSKG
jgi:hypothetical protein